MQKFKKLKVPKMERGTMDVGPCCNYPSLYVFGDAFPDIEDWKIGCVYLAKIKMSGKSISESNGKKSVSVDFQVIEMSEGPLEEKEENDKDDGSGEKISKGELAKKLAKGLAKGLAGAMD